MPLRCRRRYCAVMILRVSCYDIIVTAFDTVVDTLRYATE